MKDNCPFCWESRTCEVCRFESEWIDDSPLTEESLLLIQIERLLIHYTDEGDSHHEKTATL